MIPHLCLCLEIGLNLFESSFKLACTQLYKLIIEAVANWCASKVSQDPEMSLQ